MDNLMSYILSSDYLIPVSKESVSKEVQAPSSGDLRLIGNVLIMILLVQVVLTITLIVIELRQYHFRNIIYGLSRKVNRIEERQKAAVSKKDESNQDGAEKTKTRHSSVSNRANSDFQLGIKTALPQEPKPELRPENDKSTVPDYQSGIDAAAEVDQSFTAEMNDSPKAKPISGLCVTSDSYYDPQGLLRLEQVPQTEAYMILYSDMTVHPSPGLFRAFNKINFFSSHDLTRLYDIQNRYGQTISKEHLIRCLEVTLPAEVIKTPDGYLLDKMGILTVEEKE